jgi:hypothetical protein
VQDAIRQNGGQPLKFEVASEGVQFHPAMKGKTARV